MSPLTRYWPRSARVTEVAACYLVVDEVRLLPSRPLAGRVGRRRVATGDGAGGLRLLRACGRPPPPDPSPPLASLAGGGERQAHHVNITSACVSHLHIRCLPRSPTCRPAPRIC